MAKPENPAEAPVAARPPRPVQRVRLDGLAREASTREALANAGSSAGVSADEQGAGERARPSVSRPPAAAPLGAEHEDIESEQRAMRELIDEAFGSTAFDATTFDATTSDTARNLEAPGAYLAEDGFDPEVARIEGELSAEHSFSDDDGFEDDDAGRADEVARLEPPVDPRPELAAAGNRSAEPRPGLAWVRRRVSDDSWSPEATNGSTASASRVPKLPVASLERPSTSRVELTPSPVPRVALAPATGAVDISLVPGPHTIGARNLPTLAAQHLLRRAPRRPAAAVTLPPPAGRERAGFTLAHDVRSSKGEIVLGLTIGLGVSLLLAGLGQAYLRGDVVADGASAPAQLESVMLSARPDMPASAAPSSGAVSVSAAAAANPASAGEAASGARPPAAGVVARRRAASDARRPASAAAGNAAPGGSLVLAEASLAEATLAKRTERTPQRATPARARAAQTDPSARASAVSPAAASPAVVSPPPASPAAVPAGAAPSAPALRSPSEPPPASAPMTPAESAGLGLDLPL